MSAALKLSDEIIESARPVAEAMHRSIPKQIEYWARIGKAAEENPDLPVGFIIETLKAVEEEKAGLGKEYRFG